MRGPESGIDLNGVRRYFRAYLHCWKTTLEFVRRIKGLSRPDWKLWCERWKTGNLNADDSATWDKLWGLRNYDTHETTLALVIVGGTAPVGTPLVFVGPESEHLELVTVASKGVEILEKLIDTYTSNT